MTISIFEFEQINESSGDPVYPAHRRRVAQALSNTYLSIGETYPTRGVLVSNDNGTTGARIRIGTASSGENADQGDLYIPPNGTAFFIIARKQRDTSKTTDRIYINAVADT